MKQKLLLTSILDSYRCMISISTLINLTLSNLSLVVVGPAVDELVILPQQILDADRTWEARMNGMRASIHFANFDLEIMPVMHLKFENDMKHVLDVMYMRDTAPERWGRSTYGLRVTPSLLLAAPGGTVAGQVADIDFGQAGDTAVTMVDMIVAVANMATQAANLGFVSYRPDLLSSACHSPS
jgi:hypothetical protein